jgi:hypothetical protein
LGLPQVRLVDIPKQVDGLPPFLLAAAGLLVATSTPGALSLSNGSRPLNRWKNVVPSEKMSERSSSGSPRACSGDM